MKAYKRCVIVCSIGVCCVAGSLAVVHAQQDVTGPSATATANGESGAATSQLGTVLVTAEKVSEPALEVPMALTVLTGRNLLEDHEFRFQDFAETVPGLQMQTTPYGTNLVIRGMSANSTFSTTAVYVDDTPLTLQGAFSTSAATADLDTFDMQRIEVLKGPQGTAYGADSLAGVVKYVTNAPDPSEFHSISEAGATAINNGGTGFDVHGMVNLPLSSISALRIVGYDNYYPGFINDPSRARSDINGSHYSGSRVALLLNATSALSLRLNVLYQKRLSSNPDVEEVDPVTLVPVHGDLTDETLIDQPSDAILRVYNFTATYDTSVTNILLSSSYSDFDLRDQIDLSSFLGGLAAALLNGNYGAALDYSSGVHSFAQEVRISSVAQAPIAWLVGGYFTNENSQETAYYLPVAAATGEVLYGVPTSTGFGGYAGLPLHYLEASGFAHLDYYLSDSVDLAVGGRYSHNRQMFREIGVGLLGGGLNFGRLSSESVFTYSGDLRWHISPEKLVYAHVAKGFSPGGPNDVGPNTANLPPAYNSSTAENYEIGAKGKFLEGRGELEVDAFHIDWDKIQLQATIGGYTSITNGGTAVSDGVEGSFTYVPLSGLTMDLNVTYDNAHLTEPTPASVGGEPGNPLINAPRWSGAAHAKYERALFAGWSGSVAIGLRYAGGSYGNFSPMAAGPRLNIPSHSIIDLRAGLQSDRWTATFYVKNVGNRRAITGFTPETLEGNLGTQWAFFEDPRTYGVNASYSY